MILVIIVVVLGSAPIGCCGAGGAAESPEAAPAPAESATCDLKVVVESFRSTNGTLRLALFNSPKGFPNSGDAALATRDEAVTASTMTVDFSDLPYGEYAIVLYHDENGNDMMDKNFLGMPKEGYGASGYASVFFSEPEFEKAEFFLRSESVTIRIPLHYW